MTARPFRVGDRVRWTAPTEADRSRLTIHGWPLADECTVLEDPTRSPYGITYVYVTASYSTMGRAACPVSWLEHVDDAPASREPRAPDKACRWCHGTGAVLLVFSHAPCECVSNS